MNDPDDAISESVSVGNVTTTPITRTGSIAPDTDVDLYAFAVTAGQVVDFDIDTTLNGAGGLGSYLRLFNPQGQELLSTTTPRRRVKAHLGLMLTCDMRLASQAPFM